MNKDLMAKWQDALRSGRYRKGGDMLRQAEGWRALGVLLDVLDPGGWRETRYGYWGWHGATILVPDWVQGQVGLTANLAWVVGRLDDDCGTFAEVADRLPSVLVPKGDGPFALVMPDRKDDGRRGSRRPPRRRAEDEGGLTRRRKVPLDDEQMSGH